MSIDGTAYQVIAKLFYNDAVRGDLEAIVGFTVNLEWVRQHYFPEITEEVGRIAGVSSLAVRDDKGAHVAGTASSGGDAIRRPFPLLFLDPLLVANDPPADLPVRTWAIEVGVDTDPTLATAILIANRSLVVAAFATVTLMLDSSSASALRARVSSYGRSVQISCLRQHTKSRRRSPACARSATPSCPVGHRDPSSSNVRTSSCRNRSA